MQLFSKRIVQRIDNTFKKINIMRALIKDNGIFKTCLAAGLLAAIMVYSIIWVVTCSHILNY